jgi:hypothetical protein
MDPNLKRLRMKKSMLGIAALGLICFVFLFSLAEAQKIKTVDGVTVISNGKKPIPPKGQSATLKLTEEQTFGLGENPDEAFSEVAAFVVDAAGTVFGLDSKDRRVKVFDRSGKFLRQIGKPGQGPGELGMPANIQLTNDNNLMITDATNGKLSIFKLSGEHIKDVSTAGRLGFVSMSLDAQGNFLGQEMGLSPGDNKMYFEIKKFDPSLKPLFTLDKIEFAIPLPGSGAKINVMEMISVYQFDGSGNILYGRGNAYEIKVFDPEGKHIRTIQKDYSPEKITQQDIDEMLERMSSAPTGAQVKDLISLPETFPPFQYFFIDDQGRLYVRTYAKGKAKGEWVVDVFDSEGRFIAQFITKADLRIIKEGKAYGIEETDDGFHVIKRYALSWQ